eukprot:c17920_g1_i1.p1 GENE.c17920_g1_i1~~c17920_g1_i1.p1  ORF type:complete len:677 (+),score=171.54 c17920_g1_i1:248-2032(+)
MDDPRFELEHEVEKLLLELLGTRAHPLGRMLLECVLTFEAQYQYVDSPTHSNPSSSALAPTSSPFTKPIEIVRAVPDFLVKTALARFVDVRNIGGTILTHLSITPRPKSQSTANNLDASSFELHDLRSSVDPPEHSDDSEHSEKKSGSTTVGGAGDPITPTVIKAEPQVVAESVVNEAVKDLHRMSTRIRQAALFLFPILDRMDMGLPCQAVVENELVGGVYETLFALYRGHNRAADEKLNAIRESKTVTLASLGVKPSLDIGEAGFRPAAEALDHIASLPVPQHKLQALVYVAQTICESVTKERNKALGADELLPLFCYVVSISHCADLHAHTHMMADFVGVEGMMGELGYSLATLQTALAVLVSEEPEAPATSLQEGSKSGINGHFIVDRSQRLARAVRDLAVFVGDGVLSTLPTAITKRVSTTPSPVSSEDDLLAKIGPTDTILGKFACTNHSGVRGVLVVTNGCVCFVPSSNKLASDAFVTIPIREVFGVSEIRGWSLFAHASMAVYTREGAANDARAESALNTDEAETPPTTDINPEKSMPLEDSMAEPVAGSGRHIFHNVFQRDQCLKLIVHAGAALDCPIEIFKPSS